MDSAKIKAPVLVLPHFVVGSSVQLLCSSTSLQQLFGVKTPPLLNPPVKWGAWGPMSCFCSCPPSLLCFRCASLQKASQQLLTRSKNLPAPRRSLAR